ncbi:hypothetical protein ACWGQT_00080 [Streptomyces yangpuensis]
MKPATVRRTIALTGVALAVLFATGAEEGGCQAAPATGGPNQPPGKAGYRCSATLDKPYLYNRRLSGKVVAQCNPAPRTHTVTIQLWSKNLKTNVWKAEGEPRTSHELPTKGHTVELSVLARCQPGLWQTRVTVETTAVDPATGKVVTDVKKHETVITDTTRRDDC